MDKSSKICERCQEIDVILNDKEKEIQKLVLQLKTLSDLLHSYERETKFCKFCSVGCENETSKKCDSQVLETKVIDNDRLENSCPDSVKSENMESTLNRTTKTAETQTTECCCFCQDVSNVNRSSEDGKKYQSNITVTKEDKDYSEDYVYDENLKMYYNISSGFYYDRNSSLFYNPKTGTYYKYDYSKNTYVLQTSDKETNSEKVPETFCDSVVEKVNGLNINDGDDKSSCMKTTAFLKSDDQSTENFVLWRKEENVAGYQHNLDKNSRSEFERNVMLGSPNDWKPPEGSNVTIADLVRQVAEENTGMSDYIYDEKSHMYYSTSTGHYYDAVKQLLYEPQSGICYRYDSEKLCYEICSEELPSSLGANKKSAFDVLNKKGIPKDKRVYYKNRRKCSLKALKENDDNISEKDSDSGDFSLPEEGEIFSSDSDGEPIIRPNDQSPHSVGLPFTENSCDAYPPCIRAIVENSEKLKIGSLLLITCTGGIMGRDKSNTVYIPDGAVSMMHAEIKYSNESWKYSITDLGSQNGTFVNEVRLSEPKEISESHDLNHGDKLSLASCKLLLHIHDGFETCCQCEPGQVLAELSFQEEKPVLVYKTKEEKEKERRQEIRKLKKKYGLGGMAYEVGKTCTSDVNSGYEDKAELRRKTVGSQNPYEKNEVSSMDMVMSESNKGYQMLQKMGWKKGETLGATGSGISEPIPIRPWNSTAGLGFADSSAPPVPEDRRKRKWVKAQERYFQLS